MIQAKKLFVVKDNSGAVIEGDDKRPLYFHTKWAAKAVRDLRSMYGDVHTIAPGPDHHKYINTTEGTK